MTWDAIPHAIQVALILEVAALLILFIVTLTVAYALHDRMDDMDRDIDELYDRLSKS